ncbi:DExH-box ATP-dependent RNA helicase DExH9 [Vitis vinifera]|uniref:DExH-box ATP-dependent RNA helicase DExH9 n=1 Tax=Vitis vinifera TaxID=29760 RepID=A0A438E2D7_VITVI|nr:DExH-box ATP-dependent RNA helicase DExH9 [Vitis vinifera]
MVLPCFENFQVSNMLPLLKRGIGVHHSGLLPILKEVIEILFQEGLIKMSGRAGRRGIDERGICILMVDEKLEPSTAKMMLKGSADCLNSAFHLSYNMLLNQMRSEDGDPEKLLRNSFYQFQADRAIPDLEKQAKNLEEERDSIIIEEEDSLENYYNLIQQYKSLKKDVRDIVFSPRYCLPFLQPGRLVCIQCTKTEENSPSFCIKDQTTWAVIINFERVKGTEDDASRKPEDADYTVDVLTRCTVSRDGVLKKTIKIVSLKEPGEPVVVTVPISQAKQIDGLSSVRLIISKDLLPLEARENTLKKVSEVLSRFAKEGMPLLDPEEDMKVQSSQYRKAVRRIEALESLFDKHEVAKSPLIEQKLKVLHMKKELTAKIKSIKRTMRSSTALAFKDELKARKRVLRKLGYVTSDNVVELKGKVACEISSADELTLTELMFNGVFKDIKVEDMVSLLSCFVWREKLQDAQKPKDELELLFTQLQDTARRVAKVQLESKVLVELSIDFIHFFILFLFSLKVAVTTLNRFTKSYHNQCLELGCGWGCWGDDDLEYFHMANTLPATASASDCSPSCLCSSGKLMVQIDVESFVNSFRPDIMEAVHAWAKGSKFYQIMEITQVFEGSLIRAIRRLEEVLQQLIQAAKSIGETELEAKFEEAVSKIKRDIVFAASLYL